MKIGFFHDVILTKHNGVYYSTEFNSSIWARYKSVFETILVSTRVQESQPNQLAISSTDHVQFSPIDSYQSPKSLLTRLPRVLKEIRQNLALVDCAIIRLPSVIGWLTYFMARTVEKPVLIELVGCPWDTYRNHGMAGKLVAPIGFLLTRSAVKNSDFVIYVTEKFLQKRYPSKGVQSSISNVNLHRSSQMSTDIVRELTNDKKIIIGSIGKIDVKYKGYKSAINAISMLRKSGYDIDYEIVGPGNPKEIESEVKKTQLTGHVRTNGVYSAVQVDEWLDSIDIYIQPSLSEGLPRSVIEAMSHGLPIVVSKAGGNPELVEHEYQYPPGNFKLLANRIENIIQHTSQIASIQNLNKSKSFDSKLLQAKRETILREFKAHVSKISKS